MVRVLKISSGAGRWVAQGVEDLVVNSDVEN